MNDTTHVKGLKELHGFLQTLPAKMEQNVLRGALRAGVKVLRDEAAQRAPVAAPSRGGRKNYGNYRGLLRDSVRISVNTKRGTVTARVKAGGSDWQTKGKPIAFYAHIVHQGTKPHLIKPKKYSGFGALRIAGRWVSQVMHPGIRGNPFMSKAISSKQRDALIAMRNYIAKRLVKKHNMNVPRPGSWDDPE
jgi:HK97 gp10 family phage protein